MTDMTMTHTQSLSLFLSAATATITVSSVAVTYKMRPEYTSKDSRCAVMYAIFLHTFATWYLSLMLWTVIVTICGHFCGIQDFAGEFAVSGADGALMCRTDYSWRDMHRVKLDVDCHNMDPHSNEKVMRDFQVI
ncbi:hypothetical protein QAD02_019350 [Eretmocerus hayati]|uniref:Uncharacterized protein n=1 Tax=Eretmocerus hayati TaxID=131215 RepID=A0ACC2PJC3_9HYME|nr:hypothetical protein QAD02_019350 [Eretmocerus hayati]